MIPLPSIKRQIKDICTSNVSKRALAETRRIIDVMLVYIGQKCILCLNGKKTVTPALLDQVLFSFGPRLSDIPLYIAKSPIIRQFKEILQENDVDGASFRMSAESEVKIWHFVNELVFYLSHEATIELSNTKMKTISKKHIQLAHREILISASLVKVGDV